MAKDVLPAGAFAHVANGAGDQITFHANFKAIADVKVKPAYLSGNSKPDLSIELLGSDLKLPFFTCPMGTHGILHASAEEGTAKGTGAAGALMIMSSAANRTVEQVAQADPGAKWLQIYITPDQAVNRKLLTDAKNAGFTAVVVTLDAPAAGLADEVIRLGYKFPDLPKPYLQQGIKSGLDWADVEMVQRISGLPVLLKGVMTPELAQESVRRGLAGMIVSNHGGRQLDGLPGTFEVLPNIVQAVDKKAVVLVDGGIRRGADAFRALALGVDAVGLGRPILFALAVGGWQGVQSAYERLGQELAFAMNVAGVDKIADIDRRFIYDSLK